MCSARFSRLLLLHLEAARGKDVTSACFSTANVLTSCHPPQRALPGRLQFSSGCTKHHLFHIQSVGGTVSASEDPYRAARTSSSVTQASIWDTSASRRSRVVHEIDIMHRIQLHGVAAGSACTFGHASGMGGVGSCGGKRWHAAHAEKPSPSVPVGIEKEPLVPYDSDENSASGPGLAPFIPPSIEKLINVIMRHGKKI